MEDLENTHDDTAVAAVVATRDRGSMGPRKRCRASSSVELAAAQAPNTAAADGLVAEEEDVGIPAALAGRG